MKNVCVCFIGSKDIANLLGEEATVSDLEFRHYTKSDKVLTIVRPLGFPEKIKTLIQAVNLGERVIIELNEINKYFGEIIILLDLLEKKGEFMVTKEKQHLIEQVKKLIKGTKLDYDFRVINSNEDIKSLKEELITIEPLFGKKPLVLIDHFFNVKNVGVVALGFIKGGAIKAKDKLKLLPGGKDIQINSLQSMDVNQKELSIPARVGVSLKNCNLKNLERGSVLSNELKETRELDGEIIKSRFYDKELKSGMVINGLIARQAEFKEKIMLEKPLVILGESVIYRDDENPRVIGIIK